MDSGSQESFNANAWASTNLQDPSNSSFSDMSNMSFDDMLPHPLTGNNLTSQPTYENTSSGTTPAQPAARNNYPPPSNTASTYQAHRAGESISNPQQTMGGAPSDYLDHAQIERDLAALVGDDESYEQPNSSFNTSTNYTLPFDGSPLDSMAQAGGYGSQSSYGSQHSQQQNGYGLENSFLQDISGYQNGQLQNSHPQRDYPQRSYMPGPSSSNMLGLQAGPLQPARGFLPQPLQLRPIHQGNRSVSDTFSGSGSRDQYSLPPPPPIVAYGTSRPPVGTHYEDFDHRFGRPYSPTYQGPFPAPPQILPQSAAAQHTSAPPAKKAKLSVHVNKTPNTITQVKSINASSGHATAAQSTPAPRRGKNRNERKVHHDSGYKPEYETLTVDEIFDGRYEPGEICGGLMIHLSKSLSNSKISEKLNDLYESKGKGRLSYSSTTKRITAAFKAAKDTPTQAKPTREELNAIRDANGIPHKGKKWGNGYGSGSTAEPQSTKSPLRLRPQQDMSTVESDKLNPEEEEHRNDGEPEETAFPSQPAPKKRRGKRTASEAELNGHAGQLTISVAAFVRAAIFAPPPQSGCFIDRPSNFPEGRSKEEREAEEKKKTDDA